MTFLIIEVKKRLRKRIESNRKIEKKFIMLFIVRQAGFVTKAGEIPL